MMEMNKNYTEVVAREVAESLRDRPLSPPPSESGRRRLRQKPPQHTILRSRTVRSLRYLAAHKLLMPGPMPTMTRIGRSG
jgi:hypothetical protein